MNQKKADDEKMVRLNFYLDQDLMEQLKKESSASGVPIAEILRRMLVERYYGIRGGRR